MSFITPELLTDMLSTLLEATAPSGGEDAEARAERQRGLQAALAAFQAQNMQEMLLAVEILAAHGIAMARLGDASRAELGSVQASRLLRDAVAAQRMLLAATRALRLWRAAEAKAAAPQRQEIRPSIGPAAATAQPQAGPMPGGPAAPVRPPRAGAPSATSRPQPVPLLAGAALAGLAGRSAAPRQLPMAAGDAAGGAFGYKAALRGSAAVPALSAAECVIIPGAAPTRSGARIEAESHG